MSPRKGRVFDAQRHVAVAANALEAGLKLTGGASAGSRHGIGSTGQKDAELRFDKGLLHGDAVPVAQTRHVLSRPAVAPAGLQAVPRQPSRDAIVGADVRHTSPGLDDVHRDSLAGLPGTLPRHTQLGRYAAFPVHRKGVCRRRERGRAILSLHFHIRHSHVNCGMEFTCSGIGPLLGRKH